MGVKKYKATKEEKNITRQNAMMNDSIGRLILKMAFPTILSFLITSIYNLADTAFVSALGTSATAAVSVNQSLDMIIMMGGSMLAVGAASYISRLLGAGEKEKASRTLSTSVFSALIFGSLILIFGKIFMTPMVNLLGATDTCRQYSIDYANYVLYAAPFLAISFVLNQALRSEGAAVLSMVGMGFGGILNCIIDPFFIFDEFHFLGITFSGLGLEVAGASMATAISKIISFGILILPYIFKTCNVSFSIKKISFEKDIVKEVLAVGSSSLFRNGLSVAAGIILNNLAGDISDALLAAVGVSIKVMMFPFGFVLGFGMGYQPVAGFSWGAKNYDRVRQSYRFATKTALIGSAVMGLLLALGATWAISIFAGDDAEMLRLGRLCIILQCISLPAHAWVAIVNMLCGALGDAIGNSLLACARQGICFIPLAFPLTMLFGDVGVCSVQAAADALSILLAIPIIKKMQIKINEAELQHEKELEELKHG